MGRLILSSQRQEFDPDLEGYIGFRSQRRGEGGARTETEVERWGMLTKVFGGAEP